MTKKLDYYALLGLGRNASPEEIRKAYFTAAQRFHPDKNLAPGETEMFLEVQEAYEVLSNPKRREGYNATLPPETDLGLFLENKIIFSRKCFLRLDEPQLVYILFDFGIPSSVIEQPAPPLNLCLVLDRSTSMQGKNMDVVKATAINILHKLRSEDFFSVVAFSDKAEVVISSDQGTELSRQEARIQMLKPSGGTEIFSGLELGYYQILQKINRAKVNHVILLTDGRTYGDEQNCINLAKNAAQTGVGISGLGVGAEWNDNFLDNLASLTGGTSMYLPHPQDIQHALLDKFNRLGKTYAEETRLDLDQLDGIEIRYAFRLEPDGGILSSQSPIQLGSIVWEHNLQVLMEIVVQPEVLKQEAITIFQGSVSAVLTNRTTPANPIRLRLSRPIVNSMTPDPPPYEIINALTHLKLYRLQEQAHLEAAAGDYEHASEHLTHLATHLLAQGERDLAKTALIEAENLQKKKSFSQQGEKEIKYGTRALLNPGRMADKE